MCEISPGALARAPTFTGVVDGVYTSILLTDGDQWNAHPELWTTFSHQICSLSAHRKLLAPSQRALTAAPSCPMATTDRTCIQLGRLCPVVAYLFDSHPHCTPPDDPSRRLSATVESTSTHSRWAQGPKKPYRDLSLGRMVYRR